MPVAVLEAMHVMLPEHAEVLTPYGATECLPVTVIDSRTLLQETRMLTDAGACHGSLAVTLCVAHHGTEHNGTGCMMRMREMRMLTDAGAHAIQVSGCFCVLGLLTQGSTRGGGGVLNWPHT